MKKGFSDKACHPEFISGYNTKMLKQVQHDVSRKGFTLVELSVVLVVIGLIVGGLLMAQGLMRSAKVAAITKEIEQMRINIDLFKTKYGGIPGDLDKATTFFGSSLTYNGTGDYTLCTDEVGQFWEHMYLAGLVEEEMIGITSTVDCSTPNWLMTLGGRAYYSAAAGASPNSASGGGYFPTNGTPYGQTDTRLKLRLAKFYSSGGSIYSNNVGNSLFEPSFAFLLDAKVDDGDPDSGDVYAGRGNDNPGTTCTTRESWGGTYTDAAYQMADNDEECVMIYAIED